MTTALDARPDGSADWRQNLDTIPTVFGRLVYLRSLPDSTDLVIGYAALQVFSHWLHLGLSEQIRDLRGYLEGNGAPVPSDYDRLVPPAARDIERQLFLTDMETIVVILRVEESAPPSVL